MSSAFSMSIEIMWYLPFIPLIWLITFTEFWMFLLWYIIFFICYWIQVAGRLLRIFSSIFIRGVGLKFFYDISVLFWHQANTGLREWVGKISLLFCFWGEFVKNWYSLNVWENSLVKRCSPGIFFVGNTIITNSVFHS